MKTAERCDSLVRFTLQDSFMRLELAKQACVGRYRGTVHGCLASVGTFQLFFSQTEPPHFNDCMKFSVLI